MKFKINKICLVLFILIFSSCFSLPRKIVLIDDLNMLVKGKEVIRNENEKSVGKELLDVVSLSKQTAKQDFLRFYPPVADIVEYCLNSGELMDVVLVQKNNDLNNCTLDMDISLYKIPLVVNLFCSMSKNGNLKMKIMNVRERESKPFKLYVEAYKYEKTSQFLMESIIKKIEHIEDIILY